MIADYLVYDETSPTFLRWKKDQGKKKVGQIAGWIRDDGYGLVRLLGTRYYIHRLIYSLLHNIPIDDKIIDHVDGNPRNNEISNLRITTYSGNQRNRTMSESNTSGMCGVRKQKSGPYEYWTAEIYIDGGRLRKNFSILKLGGGNALEQAKLQRKEWEQQHGYTERHGR